MAPILGCWKIRGLVQPVRFILVYTETEFEEKWYEGRPDLSKESWMKDKFTLGLELPNLPYFIVGDIKMSQSRAILRHVAREADPSLSGTNDVEYRRIDMLEYHTWDFWMALINQCFRYTEEDKCNFLRSLPQQLELLSNFIGENKWSISDNLTYVDFMLYEALYKHKIFSSNCIDGFPKLTQFLENFEALPQISAYFLSENYIHAPLYTSLARHYI